MLEEKIVILDLGLRLHPSKIPLIRAAIVDQVGSGQGNFHRHINPDSGINKYTNSIPFIHFSIRKGWAQVVGIKEGADAILNYLAPVISDRLVIAGKKYECLNIRLKVVNFQPKLLNEYQIFGLYNWIALNRDNYEKWKSFENFNDIRRQILSRCLTEHLKMVGELFFNNREVEYIDSRILKIHEIKKINWHGINLICFSVIAESNFIPCMHMGIGRCCSFGFGQICDQSDYYRLITKK